MNEEQEQIKAQHAKELKDNPLFKQIMSEIKGELVSKLSNVGMNDRDMQQSITLSFQLLNSIEKYIEVAISTGKVTEFNLKQKDSILKRVRKVI